MDGRLIFAVAALLVLPGCTNLRATDAVVPVAAVPNAPGADMTQDLASLESATSVLVVVYDPDVFTRASLKEYNLKQWGCSFGSSDRQRIASIAAALRQAHIQSVPGSRTYPDSREGVFFTMKNGVEHKFVFAPAYAAVATVQGRFDDNVIVADGTLPQAIYGWLAPVSHGSPCDGFIQKYK